MVQVHPSHPVRCSQHRCAAGPYKSGRAARSAATAGLDTQDYNQDNGHGPRDFGDRATNADRSGSTPLTGAKSYPRRRNLGAGPPKAGCECSTHSVGANHAVEAHRDVQRIGNAQAAGANPAIGTTRALQALTAERPSRKREVDRATRSWGTSHGSLTQRDRDPPFKRSDAGAIPARPTICPSRTESGAPAL